VIGFSKFDDLHIKLLEKRRVWGINGVTEMLQFRKRWYVSIVDKVQNDEVSDTTGDK
jgi:hypothetical protein